MSKEYENTIFNNKSIPIPPILHSVEKDGPFEKCIVCSRNLLNDNCTYLIEKGFRRDHVIFECAICLQCRESMNDIISRESEQKLRQYWSRKVDMKYRRQKLLKKTTAGIEPWIEYCLLSGTPRIEADFYQICAQCQGGSLILSYFPCIIAEPAIEEIMRFLSKKTKKSLDDFTGKYLGLPPEFADLPSDFLILM